MSIRAKVLLFASVALGITGLMGSQLFLGASRGQAIRYRSGALHEQLSGYLRLESSTWPYLHALLLARQEGRDTLPVLREQEQRVAAQQERLLATMAQPDQWPQAESREDEEVVVREVCQALLHWSNQVEARVRAASGAEAAAPGMEWALYEGFAQGAGKRIASVLELKQRELEGLRSRWDRNARFGIVASVALSSLSLVVVLVLAAAILVPMRRPLRELVKAAERIGRGDFEIALPTAGRDELGLLSRAFDRMAHELRDSLREKQQMIKAEAEATEREMRRYNALLEETVRARTSELAAVNAQLQESLQQLKEAQGQFLLADRLSTVGRLAAGVVHEINNPLAYVSSNIRFIQKEIDQFVKASPAPQLEDLREAITDAREGIERVRLIVQDLRSLSRPDDVQLSAVDLGAVIRSSAKIAAYEARNRARLVADCGGIPEVHGNAARLGQVFLNLLINAAQAIEPGREAENEIRVQARVSAPGRVCVEVRDTGCGIPKEDLERVFDPFFTTKPIGVGSGLGLPVCRGIVTSLGGSIEVESEVGRGTTFRVELQLVEGSGTPKQEAA